MSIEAMKLALEALEFVNQTGDTQTFDMCYADKAITAIKEALAQPEQEPVALMNNKDFEPIRVRIMQEAYELADRNDSEGYNAIKVMCGDVQRMLPPQRTWVGLTDDDKKQIAKAANYNWEMTAGEYAERIGRLTEAKLKEKNT